MLWRSAMPTPTTSSASSAPSPGQPAPRWIGRRFAAWLDQFLDAVRGPEPQGVDSPSPEHPVNILKLAWRNVWRNSRRSGVTIAAMAIALVDRAALFGPRRRHAHRHGRRRDRGRHRRHPALHAGLRDQALPVRGDRGSGAPHGEQMEAEGFRATERLFTGGLAASGESSAGVGFIGIDPVKDATRAQPARVRGRGRAWLDDSDPLGVIVGRGLARTLDLRPRVRGRWCSRREPTAAWPTSCSRCAAS